MSNADPHIWPGARRRNALAERLLGGALLLCGLGLALAALASKQDCDWAPTGETGQETEQELARKRKQFDDCMARAGGGLSGNGDGAGGSAGEASGPLVSTGKPQVAGNAPRPVLVEDDVARLIREAAEKETDPVHQAALWEQYNGYVETLWTQTGETGRRPGEAGQKTEQELREELARKLKQFDESTAQIGDGDGLGKDGDGTGASAGDSADLMASGADPAQAGDPAGIGGSAEDADAAGREVAVRPASPTGDSAKPLEPASPLPAVVPSRSEGQPPREVASAGRPQGAGDAPRKALVEDNVARLIREAAEKETDPVRQAALWEQYNSYVKTL